MIPINGKVLVSTVALAALGVAGLVLTRWHGGVAVVVRNTDAAPLSDVTVHVTGRDYPIGDMPAGATRTVLVDPTGESHIEISRREAGGRARQPVDCYFEGGYTGTIEIDLARSSVAVVANEIAVGLW